MVEDPELARDPAQHRDLLGGVSGHDVRVLVIGGLAPDLCGERADVVGDEPVHGGPRTGRWRVPRGRHAFADLEPVVVVNRVEKLRVGVVVLLARVRVR